MSTELILGIDIGGSAVKGAPVNIKLGELCSERYRVEIPELADPDSVSEVIASIVNYFNWKGPIGCTFPGVIKKGVIHTAANFDKSWIGINGETLIASKLENPPVFLLNDADAAGIAEMELGAGRGRQGVVIMLTFGTGIGTAIFSEGQLLPNTEFGHLEILCREAESFTSARARKKENLNWKKWTERVNQFLARMENLFWPDVFIVGGGVSRKHTQFLHLLKSRAEIVPAKMQNKAGIIGAALAANRQFEWVKNITNT